MVSSFWVARVSGGRGWGVFETNVSIFRVLSFTSVNAFWTLLGLANSAWDFLGVKFWSRVFYSLFILVGRGGGWGVGDFFLHSIIPVT